MEGAYWVAWIVLYLVGIGLIVLCVYPLRRHFYLSFFLGAMGVYWMLVPIPFSEVHWAPLFVTLTFQLFLDPEANYAFSATAATVGSFTILAATLALYGLNFGYRHIAEFVQRRLHSMRDYPTSSSRESNENDIEYRSSETRKTGAESKDRTDRA